MKTSALNNVLKALSALRMTLSDEERKILDSIVITPAAKSDDVEGHAVQPKYDMKAQQKDQMAAQGKTLPSMPDDDVEGHAIQPKADMKAQQKDQMAAQGKTQPATLDDDVEGHAVQPKYDMKAQQKDQMAAQGKTFPAADDDEVEGHQMQGRITPVITFDAAKGRYAPKLSDKAAEK